MSARTDVTPHPGVAGLVAGLEPAQREAVLADDPVVCVLAGAGTGKTRVLTLRVARRVRDQSAHPSHVLVCTFSRKAAEELRHRLWGLGVGAEVQAGTFHRTALRLITHHRHDRGQAPPVLVADRRPLLAELLDSAGRRPPGGARARSGVTRRAPRQGRDVSRLDAEIGWAKSRLVGPADYEEASRQAGRRAFMPAARVAELYERYQTAQRIRGSLDLDDLLWHCGDLLEQDAAFTRAIRWWHRHLFVDEMQDLNDAQYRLLRLLVGEEPDLFVVGDPNQSVYGWNGADPELLQRVTEEYAGTRVVRLETNHRCAASVVRIAAAVLGRADPPPSARAGGPLPTVSCLENDEEEARWVARHVWLAHRPGRRWSSIAVLARTNAQLVRIADALNSEHVPHSISGGELGPASDVRGVGGRPAGPARDPETEDGVDGSESDETELKSGSEGTADTIDEVGPATRVAGGSADAAGNVGNPDGDAVVLSTFHRAKGLQWRTVFVVGVSDGFVPLFTARSSAAKAEERRLFYVALTRAEEELSCTWALRPDANTGFDDTAEAIVAEGVVAERALAERAAAEGAGAERRASPWLSSVERALEELREGATEASPARASEHLAKIRGLVRSPGAGADAVAGVDAVPGVDGRDGTDPKAQ